jgi:hypothetical protein
MMAQRLVFQPPPAKTMEQYARAVCQQLEQTLDAVYASPEVVRGFTAFVQTVAAIAAEHRNRLDESAR